VWATNCLEWVLLERGAAYAGITLVTVNPAYQAEELRHVLTQSRSSGVLVQDSYRGRDLLPVVAEARVGLPQFAEVIALSVWDKIVATGSETRALPTVAPGDPAQIQYTSGTTGLPKGAQLTHRGLVNVGRCDALANGAGPGDVWVNPICKVVL
jgi:fatty-acyl-CoA synthase